MEANKHYAPSYGWRSLIGAKELLQRGLRKTIGNGHLTRVWMDNWIPDTLPRTPKEGSVDVVRDPNLRISSLFRQGGVEWDFQKLHSLFHQDDVTVILGLRPNPTQVSEGFVWNQTKTGVYTVRSGYELLRTMTTDEANKQVLEPSTTALKAQVWKTHTTGKLKHFMWQAISGCLPVAKNLFSRHLGHSPACTRCGQAEESTNHLLFECPPALQVWALSDYPSPPGEFPSQSLFRNIDYLLWRTSQLGLPDRDIEPFPWIMWYIWKARNLFNFEGTQTSPLETLRLAVSEASNWLLAQHQEEQIDPQNRKSQLPSQIQSHILGTFYCRTDASWSSTGKVSGLGWHYRNRDGTQLFGWSACRRSLSALHAEVDGLMWALWCLLDREVSDIRVETDCADLVKMLEDPDEWPTFRVETAQIAELRRLFHTFHLGWIPRSHNTVADELAKKARQRGEYFTNVTEHPPLLISNPSAVI